MKINVVALCKNEAKILPFFLDHYSGFCDSIVLCDGHSTDGSSYIAKKYPKVQFVDCGDEDLHDGHLTELRNEFYKQFQSDWQIVCDVDEFLYAEDIRGTLQRYQQEGITIPILNGYQMGSLTFPQYGIPLIQQVFRGSPDSQWLNKKLVFNPSQVSINYFHGCHECHPTGNVNYSQTAELKLLHYRYLSYDYLIFKSSRESRRQSSYNVQNQFGVHYAKLRQMTEEEYNQLIQKMVVVV